MENDPRPRLYERIAMIPSGDCVKKPSSPPIFRYIFFAVVLFVIVAVMIILMQVLIEVISCSVNR